MVGVFETSCARCGVTFTAKNPRATYCSTICRVAASKARRAQPVGEVVSLPGAKGAGTIEAAVLAQLGSQLDTVVGRQAVIAARRLDGSVSDSAWSPMSRRLHELLDQAAQAAALAASQGGAGVESNPIAFLKARAEEREHGAAI